MEKLEKHRFYYIPFGLDYFLNYISLRDKGIKNAV